MAECISSCVQKQNNVAALGPEIRKSAREKKKHKKKKKQFKKETKNEVR